MLNPQLYAALNRKFKNSGGVRIHNEDIRNQWRTVIKGGQNRKELVSSGQQFSCCCPWCNDTRHRCYVNYEFGVVDIDGHTNLNLIHCFNEECFYHMPERKSMFFWEVLFGKPIAKSTIGIGKIRTPGEYVTPGALMPIHTLNATHIAYKYLEDRGYNLTALGTVYKISWCVNSKFKYAQSRIIIPVIENGKDVGWLARITQDGDFTEIDGHKIPKYFNMPGFSSQKHLFNWGIAKQFKTIILVEGAFDAIKVGSPAAALLGKSISTYNLEKLLSHVSRNEVQVIVALDPDKPITDRNSRHHIEVAVNKIKQHYQKVMPLYLPSGTDPGSLSRDEFKRYLYKEADKEGIQLNFSKINGN